MFQWVGIMMLCVFALFFWRFIGKRTCPKCGMLTYRKHKKIESGGQCGDGPHYFGSYFRCKSCGHESVFKPSAHWFKHHHNIIRCYRK